MIHQSGPCLLTLWVGQCPCYLCADSQGKLDACECAAAAIAHASCYRCLSVGRVLVAIVHCSTASGLLDLGMYMLSIMLS